MISNSHLLFPTGFNGNKGEEETNVARAGWDILIKVYFHDVSTFFFSPLVATSP